MYWCVETAWLTPGNIQSFMFAGSENMMALVKCSTRRVQNGSLQKTICNVMVGCPRTCRHVDSWSRRSNDQPSGKCTTLSTSWKRKTAEQKWGVSLSGQPLTRVWVLMNTVSDTTTSPGQYSRRWLWANRQVIGFRQPSPSTTPTRPRPALHFVHS